MSAAASASEYRYRRAWWLPGPHAQTIWGRFARKYPGVPLASTRLVTPDGDNLELHVLEGSADAPRVLMLHGLEGSVRSHYVGGAFAQAYARGWGAVLMVHRGCGTAPNRSRRFYHSGETSDLDFALADAMSQSPRAPWFLLGVSLGGNVLVKWLGEKGADINARVAGAAAVSVPFDLEAGARHISRGFARVYDRSFLRSLRRKAVEKLAAHPDLFDLDKLARARCIFDFDEAVTAPVHGFSSARDYYARSSALGYLDRVRVPTLLLSARDDPFLPSRILDRVAEKASRNPALTVEFADHGGHVGFVSGAVPWKPFYYAEWRAFRFFEDLLADR